LPVPNVKACLHGANADLLASPTAQLDLPVPLDQLAGTASPVNLETLDSPAVLAKVPLAHIKKPNAFHALLDPQALRVMMVSLVDPANPVMLEPLLKEEDPDPLDHPAHLVMLVALEMMVSPATPEALDKTEPAEAEDPDPRAALANQEAMVTPAALANPVDPANLETKDPLAPTAIPVALDNPVETDSLEAADVLALMQPIVLALVAVKAWFLPFTVELNLAVATTNNVVPLSSNVVLPSNAQPRDDSFNAPLFNVPLHELLPSNAALLHK